MKTLRRVARNVSSLAQAQAFYASAAGFTPVAPPAEDAPLAALLGVSRVRSARMQMGRQQIELTECFPAGAAYPVNAGADDIFFQHIAIVTTDIFAAAARALQAGAEPISIGGPQTLPPESGGVIAWKFRDPDGHPLEFLQFSNNANWPGGALYLGYDHSAISVSDIPQSTACYAALGCELRHRQLNQGAAQNCLDGLANTIVDVVAMAPPAAPPHVELLCYHHAASRLHTEINANDIAADRLVFGGMGGSMRMEQDPDGHYLLFEV